MNALRISKSIKNIKKDRTKLLPKCMGIVKTFSLINEGIEKVERCGCEFPISDQEITCLLPQTFQ